ncbi:MAG: hypothetical protein JXQ30_10805 [Spirochaetes bacterium]|nr:hypothetical protein [Spirochaetota bacterium]
MRQPGFTKEVGAVCYTVIGAFFLALIVGLVVKNPFATVLVRAFVCAFLFGGLVYAGMWMLKRYIPELELADKRKKIIEEAEKESPVPFTEYTDKDSGRGFPEQKPQEGGNASAADTEDGLEERAGGEMRDETGAVNAAGEDDSLPSLDGLFTDEAKTIPDYQTEAEPSPSRKKGEPIKVGNFRIPYEPETLAKAIKKVMSQDEGR